MSDAPRRLTGTRGQRYGEVILVYLGATTLVEVYNSYGLNDCPEDLWQALDPAALAAQHGATLALLNGPRYWMMDGIGKVDLVEPVLRDFGGIAMRRAATLNLGGDLERRAYRERRVNRGAAWYFDAGKPVYELFAPGGETYVLQAYCTGVDPWLTGDSLGALGGRLRLRQGWRYAERVLDQELVVDTTATTALVLQDELENSYSRVV